MIPRITFTLAGLLFLQTCVSYAEADSIDKATANGVAYLIAKQDKHRAIRETDAPGFVQVDNLMASIPPLIH